MCHDFSLPDIFSFSLTCLLTYKLTHATQVAAAAGQLRPPSRPSALHSSQRSRSGALIASVLSRSGSLTASVPSLLYHPLTKLLSPRNRRVCRPQHRPPPCFRRLFRPEHPIAQYHGSPTALYRRCLWQASRWLDGLSFCKRMKLRAMLVQRHGQLLSRLRHRSRRRNH